jgi:hypothetical protein
MLVLPLEIAIPLPEAVFTVTVSPVPFFIIYTLLAAGHINVAAPLKSDVVSVKFSIAARDSEVEPSAVDNVAELVLQVSIVFRPATASSTIEVTWLFSVSPQVPVSSPCVGNASFKDVVYAVAIY